MRKYELIPTNGRKSFYGKAIVCVDDSGADTLRTLTHEQCETLESILEDMYPDGMSETELNDLLWFEDDTIAEWLGFEDWEALERFNNGEDEEEEEEN